MLIQIFLYYPHLRVKTPDHSGQLRKNFNVKSFPRQFMQKFALPSKVFY